MTFASAMARVTTLPVRFGAGANPAELLDTMEKTLKVLDTQKEGRNRRLTVEFNNNPYEVTVTPDGTFSARSKDGKVQMRLLHNSRVYGAPLEFEYTNTQTPGRDTMSRESVLVNRARAFARKLFDAVPSGSDL